VLFVGQAEDFFARFIVNLRETFTSAVPKKVKPQRITASAESASTKGSRVYVRLQ
jgi:hypothetical protein